MLSEYESMFAKFAIFLLLFGGWAMGKVASMKYFTLLLIVVCIGCASDVPSDLPHYIPKQIGTIGHPGRAIRTLETVEINGVKYYVTRDSHNAPILGPKVEE